MASLLIRALCGILTLTLLSCANKAPQPKDNSSLVVTYYGKEVHRRGTGWVSLDKLNKVVKKPGKKIFIFGAPWCKACGFLRKAIKQADVKHEIHWINVDEDWGRKLLVVMGVRDIPFMAAIDEKGNLMATRVGPSQITMYLLLN